LFCADDVNLLGDSINTIKENTESFSDANKYVGLEKGGLEKMQIKQCI